MAPGRLIIRPKGASLERDTSGILTKMDPYCVISIGMQKFETKVASSGGKEPQWNDQFMFNLTAEDMVTVEVWDRDRLSANDKVGEAMFSLASIPAGSRLMDIPLLWKGKSVGVLHLETEFIPGGQTIPTGAQGMPTTYQAPVGGIPQQQYSTGTHSLSWAPPKLGKDVVKGNAEQVFQQYDRNRSGRLEFAEFYPALIELCQRIGVPPPSQPQVEAMIQKFDRKEPGRVDIKEFKRMTKGIFGVKSY